MELSDSFLNALATILIIATVAYLVSDRRSTTKFNKDALANYNQQMEKYKHDYAIWEKLYICNRCGNIFRVDDE